MENHKFFSTKAGTIISILVTQYFVFLAWIAFRVHDFGQLTYSMQRYVMLDFATSGTSQFILDHKVEIGFIMAFLTLHFILYRKINIIEKISMYKLKYWFIIILVIIISILYFYNGNP